MDIIITDPIVKISQQEDGIHVYRQSGHCEVFPEPALVRLYLLAHHLMVCRGQASIRGNLEVSVKYPDLGEEYLDWTR